MRIGNNCEVIEPNFIERLFLKGAQAFKVVKVESVKTEKGTKIEFLIDDANNVVAIKVDNLLIHM